jgi:hypothetical protein
VRLRALRVFPDKEGVIARGHRVVHGNQSISRHEDGVSSSKHSKIFDEPWVYLQNESRSSSRQSVSLEDEDVSLEKHRVVGDQEEKILVEQTVVLAKLRVLLTKDRVILADEAVGLGDQDVLSRRLRVGRPREDRSLWLVAVCDPVQPSYLVNRTNPILPSPVHVDFWFRRSIFGRAPPASRTGSSSSRPCTYLESRARRTSRAASDPPRDGSSGADH